MLAPNWRLSLAGLVVVALAGTTGRAEAPRNVSSKDGIYKGVVGATPAGSFDALHLLCKLDLSYAVWTLLGEPVQDFLFRWEACPDDVATVPELGMTFAQIKREFPSLAKDLAGVKPEGVVLRARVRFYESPAGGTPFATGLLDVTPDLYAASGKAETFSVPESPSWDQWFVELKSSAPTSNLTKRVAGRPGERCSTLCPNASQVVGASCKATKNPFSQVGCTCDESASPPYATVEYTCGSGQGLADAFRRAKLVDLADLEVTRVDWPSLGGVVVTVQNAREKERRAAAAKMTDDAFWGSAERPSARPSLTRKEDPAPRDALAAARAARKGTQAKFEKAMTNGIARDASGSQGFGVTVSGEESWRPTVDGSARPLDNGRLALGPGRHQVVLEGAGGRFSFEADCSSTTESVEIPCTERHPPSSDCHDCLQIIIHPYCDRLASRFRDVTRNSCRTGAWKFSFAR